MEPRLGRVLSSTLLTIGALFALAGCSKNAVNGPTPTPTPQNSVSFSVVATGSAQALPTGAGLTGTATFGPATTGAGTTFTIAETSLAGTGLPAINPPNVPIIFYQFSDPSNVTFSAFPALTITLPTTVSTTGQVFYLAYYDPNNVAAGWQFGFDGPATVTGQTLTFPAGTTPFAMSAGKTYNFALYEVSSSGPTPTPPPGTQSIYVSNSAAGASRNTILIFPSNSSGNVIPTGSISGPATGLNNPNGLAFDSAGTLIVANAGSITKYASGATGNAAPSATITSATLVNPQFVGVASNNDFFVTQNTATGGADSVQGYTAAASGPSTPATTIAGASTGLSVPYGVAVDSAGTIYVANNGNNSVTEYATGANGNVAPTATIAGAATNLQNPTGIAVDSSGIIYVANANNTITVFAKGTTGNTAPTATIAGSATLLNSPMELYLSNGRMYAANNGLGSSGTANSIVSFLTNSTGNVAPNQFIQGSSTGLAQPFGVAVK